MSTMTSQSMPRSMSLSAVIHGSVVLLIVALTWWTKWRTEESAAHFELVAGPGDNYAATEAPTTAEPVALPSVNLKIPKPKPTPARPKPVETPPVTVIKTVPAPKPETVQKPKPIPEPTPAKTEPAPERVSYQQFAAENGVPKPKTPKKAEPIKTTTIDVGRVAGAVTNKVDAGAGGRALTAAETEMSKAYVALIVQRIRAALEAAGINDLREAGIQFSVSVRGELSNARITHSSGSAAFDRAVLNAVGSVRPIGPPPTGKAEVFSTAVRLSEG